MGKNQGEEKVTQPHNQGPWLCRLELQFTPAVFFLRCGRHVVRVRPHIYQASTYSPGWFHPGAERPDFKAVDVRATQDLNYAKNQYVTSDLNPGVVFLGKELEFNSKTKYFYTDRSLPKKKLTEAEMLEINRLYRAIARDEGELSQK